MQEVSQELDPLSVTEAQSKAEELAKQVTATESYKQLSVFERVLAWGLHYQNAANEALSKGEIHTDAGVSRLAQFAISELRKHLNAEKLPTPEKGIGYNVKGNRLTFTLHWSKKQKKVLEAQHNLLKMTERALESA